MNRGPKCLLAKPFETLCFLFCQFSGHNEVYGDILYRVPGIPGRVEQPVLVL